MKRWFGNAFRRHRTLSIQIAAFLFIWVLGAVGYWLSWKPPVPTGLSGVFEYLYRSLQLFGLNHNGQGLCEDYSVALQFARFLAPLFLVLAVISLISGAIIRVLANFYHLAFQDSRVVVLGYGPIGQAIAARLRNLSPDGTHAKWHVTVVAPKIDAAMARAAERDEVALFEDDPSDPASFGRIRAMGVSRVYVALENDLANLDAAESYKKWKGEGGKKPDLRIFVEDEELAANLPDAASTGFMCGEGLQLYSAKLEAARELLQRARFDRLALAAGQTRVHVVVAGGGGQGIAVANEVLLQCWRAGLAAPMITLLDRRASDVKSKFERRCPALFKTSLPIGPSTQPGWVPPECFDVDMDTLDAHSFRQDLKARFSKHPVTAWVAASAEDDRNLRVGLSLQTQMMRKDLPAAAIYLRVWAAHCRDADQLENRIVSLTHTFGSLQNALSVTQSFQQDPVAIAKDFHVAYAKVSAELQGASPEGIEKKRDAIWNVLTTTLKESNRRLFRHAAYKLNDLGLDWRESCEFIVPEIDATIRSGVSNTAESLDYMAAAPAFALTAPLADRVLAVARLEHDRWTVDRAVDGWQPGKPRDNVRRIHPNMAHIDQLSAGTRRYDGVMLKALMQAPPVGGVGAHKFKRCVLDLSRFLDPSPDTVDGVLARVTEAALVMPVEDWKVAFERRKIELPDPEDRKSVQSAFARFPGALAVRSALEAAAKGDVLCRIVVAFCQPPDQYAIEFAEWLVMPALVASNHAVKIESYWSWPAGDGTGSFPGLVDEEATF